MFLCYFTHLWIEMETADLIKLINVLVALPQETEWVEFKRNFHSPEEIGERLSALSNSACLWNKPYGYLIFGIDDTTHDVVGTTFKAKSQKKGNEELEMWLSLRLNPKIDFEVYEFDYSEEKHISLYRIPAAINVPVEFINISYIRVGSLTKRLSMFKEKESKIWRKSNSKPLNKIFVKNNLSMQEIFSLLSVESYFDLMKLPMPTTGVGIIEKLKTEQIVVDDEAGFAITELGAILFAKNLSDFDSVKRKSVRVIVYNGKNKLETEREQMFSKGYALSFETMIDWIKGQLPANEEIGKALRRDVTMYPEITIREIVANMIIHQDFAELGFPMVEIYSDRVDISNPGQPLISADRFIDEYVSRNESMADIMRRMGFCEEKGSGLDKALINNEIYKLPPIKFSISENRTTVTMFSYRPLSEISKQERLSACYQHACVKYVSGEFMTNQSLRERFGVEQRNYPMISRIIKDAIDSNLIKEADPENKNRRYVKYIPYWA